MNFESYEVNGGYGWFDGQHNEPTEMTRKELIEYINFLQSILDNSENE